VLAHALRAAVAALVLLSAACASVAPRPDPPLATLEQVRVLRIADAKADLALRLRLANPNDYALSVESITFEVALDGRPAAAGRSTRIDTLPARGDAEVDVAGRVDIGAIATALMTLGSRLPVRYALSGSATLAGGIVLPFSRKGEIPVARFDGAVGPRPQ